MEKIFLRNFTESSGNHRYNDIFVFSTIILWKNVNNTKKFVKFTLRYDILSIYFFYIFYQIVFKKYKTLLHPCFTELYRNISLENFLRVRSHEKGSIFVVPFEHVVHILTHVGENRRNWHVLESAIEKKCISLKIMKTYVLNTWISFLHFPMDKDCIEND